MIAQLQARAFEPLLDDLSRFAPADGGAADMRPYPAYGPDDAEPDPHGFLSHAAMPNPDLGACAIGVIDDAIPFLHDRLTVGGASRVASVWLQGAAGMPATDDPHAPGCDLPFGREWRGDGLTALRRRHRKGGSLDERAAMGAAGAIDHARATRQGHAAMRSHGAAIADIAAGFTPDDPTGRQFPVLAVSLPPEVSRDTSGTFMPYYVFLSTLHLIHRTRRLARWIEHRRGQEPGTLRLPLVVNLSFGLMAGGKDGWDLGSRFRDALIQHGQPDMGEIRFVLPMGNHRLVSGHAEIATGGAVDWHLQPDDRTPSFVEFWDAAGPDAPPMQLGLALPGGVEVRTAFTGFAQACDLQAGGRHLARAYLQRHGRGDGRWRQSLTLAVPPTVPTDPGTPWVSPGAYRLRPVAAGPVHAFAQRDDSLRGSAGSGGRQSRFSVVEEAEIVEFGTLNALACGARQIRVGATDAAGRPARYSGLDFKDAATDPVRDRPAFGDRSPTRPGLVTAGLPSGSRQALSGTSVAAPAVTRALAFELAGLPLSAERRLAEF